MLCTLIEGLLTGLLVYTPCMASIHVPMVAVQETCNTLVKYSQWEVTEDTGVRYIHVPLQLVSTEFP